MDTWQKWREHVEAAGMTFTQAPEYAAAVRAAHQIRPFVHDFAPDVAVGDILTPGPARPGPARRSPPSSVSYTHLTLPTICSV